MRTTPILAVALALVMASIVSLAAASHDPRASLFSGDLKAFYCGARVLREGADPYRTAPLAACESGLADASTVTGFERGVDPVPLPGYALALFVPFSALPFDTAAILWLAILVAAIVATVEALHRLTGLARLLVAAVLLGPEVISAVPYGQLAPVAILGVSAAALFLARGRPRLAALVAALTFVQPQLALVTSAALLLFVPRSRVVVLAVGGALGLISLAALGVHGNLEYVASVLPAQARAEAPFDIQLSFAWLVQFAGAPEGAALRVASAEYALAALAGLALTWRLRPVLGSAAVIFIPAAMSAMGGTYEHVFQLGVAMPCALWLVARNSAARPAAWFAVLLIGIPWQDLASRAIVLLSAIATAIMLWTALAKLRRPARLAAIVLAVAFVAVEPVLVTWVPPQPIRPIATVASFRAAGSDAGLASYAHGLWIRGNPERVALSWQVFAQKVPFWAGLVALCWALAAASRSGRRAGEHPISGV